MVTQTQPGKRRFIQCDVFSSHPTKGNALAVVLDCDGLDDAALKSFARWTNLAETTFLFPPDDQSADYKVRILTPTREMPFAGHPTLGSCAAWLHAGGKPKNTGVVRQECGVGIVEIDISNDVPAFISPPTKIQSMPPNDVADLTNRLNISVDQIVRYAVLDNGPVWHVFELQSAEQVLAVDSSLVNWTGEKYVGLIGSHSANHECDFEVRMLSPNSGMNEDPITGSLNSALAHWRLHNKELSSPVLVSQGTCVDCIGRVSVTPDPAVDGQVRIGGITNILIEGTVTL